MCFEVPTLVPPGGTNGNKGGPIDDDDDGNDDDLGIMDIDDNDSKAGQFSNFLCSFQAPSLSLKLLLSFVGKSFRELEALNESLRDLLDGIQVSFMIHVLLFVI